MVAALSQIVIVGGLLWAALYFAFRVGRAERPAQPDPAAETARAHAEAMRAHTDALLTFKQPADTPSPERPPFDPSWSRDVKVIDAIWRAHLGRWNDRVAYLQDDWTSKQPLFQIASDFRQKAFDGLIPVWATKPRSDLYEIVPPDFWRNHALEASYIVLPKVTDTWVSVTYPLIVGEVPHARTNAWNNFMTSRKVVEQLWPAKSGVPSRKMPLMDAVNVARQQTKASRIEAIANRDHANEPDGVLTYYAYQIIRTIPLYGKRSPSDEYEAMPDEILERYDLIVEKGRFTAKQSDGNDTLIDLAIAETDLAAALAYLEALNSLDVL